MKGLADLRRPRRLEPGDRVAAVSLSGGLAGDSGTRWRYEVGKKRLIEDFGLDVVEMPHTLAGSEYLYNHPEKRAADLMLAFSDPSIHGVFSCIGGTESIRILPYVDFGVIASGPKVFIGYSDTTVTHFICLKAGIAGFYGASILAEFAENVRVFPYTEKWIRRTLFESSPPGVIPHPGVWTGEFIPWEEGKSNVLKKMEPHEGFDLIQGTGIAEGRLIGGCMDVLEVLKGTELWPPIRFFDGAILFLETSEQEPAPQCVEHWLRNYAAMGVLERVNGIIWGKPARNHHIAEYRSVIAKIVAGEAGRPDMPILYNMSFGHNEPMCCLPYGAKARIDCGVAGFSILEPGVL